MFLEWLLHANSRDTHRAIHGLNAADSRHLDFMCKYVIVRVKELIFETPNEGNPEYFPRTTHVVRLAENPDVSRGTNSERSTQGCMHT